MSYTPIVVNVDEVTSYHDDDVALAFQNLAPAGVLYATVDRSYDIKNSKILTVEESAAKLIGFVDVINWSFSKMEWVSKYDYSNTVIKQGYLKNTAFTTSAGNQGEGFVYGYDPVTDIRTYPGWGRIAKYQSTPYDFTIGAIDTFDWKYPYSTSDDPDNYKKVAKFELANFSEVTPKFVDFYTQGDGGTSYAAPRVAGMIAHIKQYNPNYNLNEIRTILERNSKYLTFERDGNTWTAQVLDPWNIQTNMIRDGKNGKSINMFTDGITESDYTWTFDPKHIIDQKTKVEALFEVFSARNPSQEIFNTWVDIVDKNKLTVAEAINEYVKSTLFGNIDNMPKDIDSKVPLIERVQGLYHLGLGREPTLEETVMAIDHYNAIDQNFKEIIVDFIGYYNIDLSAQTW